MNSDLTLIIDITEREYRGMSFNAPPLRTMLNKLTLEEVTSTDTYEGYSVWGIVLHLAYWKYWLAGFLGAQALPPFPYEQKNWPALPAECTEQAWRTLLADMDAIHAAYIETLRVFPAERLSEVTEWKYSYGDVITWMSTHDTYHIAQIRNMGLKHFAEGE